MGRLDKFQTIPAGSLLTLSERESDPYFNKIAVMPARLKGLMTSINTGAFIRGLATAYQIPSEKASSIAVQIVQIAVGENTLAQLPSLLSTKLKLPNDKAQKMAKEIEEDLLKPVRKELEEFWDKQKREEPIEIAEERASQSGANNVLNLKEEKKPPTPPWRKENRN